MTHALCEERYSVFGVEDYQCVLVVPFCLVKGFVQFPRDVSTCRFNACQTQSGVLFANQAALNLLDISGVPLKHFDCSPVLAGVRIDGWQVGVHPDARNGS